MYVRRYYNNSWRSLAAAAAAAAGHGAYYVGGRSLQQHGEHRALEATVVHREAST